jgi:hypothetical protein
MNRKAIKDTVKKEVSYKQSYKCKSCSLLLPPTFQIDHIIPWSLCHDDSEENLQALCANCHSIKTQREALRIIQYKKLLNDCPNNCSLCWFCVETSSSDTEHTCEKVLKDISKLKQNQEKILSSVEELFEKYKYVKKTTDETTTTTTLHIKILLYNNTIHVDNVIVKFTDELDISHIVEAVFLATRTKKKSLIYETIVIEIEVPERDDEAMEQCIAYIDNSDIIERLPPRIFKSDHIVIVYV